MIKKTKTIDDMDKIIDVRGHDFKVGQKVFVQDEVLPYKVRACDDRFAICTKPYNPQRTVQYFIIDKKLNIRGTENLIFCMGFETDEECNSALERLQSGESEISSRNYRPLDIVKIKTADNLYCYE